MILLAADTSGKQGSIAIARCIATTGCEVLEVVNLAGGTFSAQLVPQVAALLAKHDLNKNDIDSFAVASGPGSFTGLRVGLAAIKAFAEVLGKPIASVSLLESVAVEGGMADSLAVLDAGRTEVYVGEFLGNKLVSERLLTLQELLNGANGLSVVTPDATVAAAIRASGSPVKEIERPRSDAIARLGWKKLQAEEIISAEDLEANYIRRSDAEIFSRLGSLLMPKVRPATAADIPAIMELEKDAATAAHWSGAQYEALLAEDISDGPSRLSFVVEEEGAILGFVVAHQITGEWEIENLVIREAAHRRGLGRHLVVKFLETARSCSAEVVFLEVRESNQGARSLYEQLAFVESGRRPRYYSDPQEDAIQYRLKMPKET
jgi:tRNA threonylcarbamoyladenosine biosynthesis protein TsaB